MIFIGYNLRIGFPRYHNHHSRWTDSRILPVFIRRWWNELKEKDPSWQIIEWIIAYRKPYCKKCIEMFIEDEDFLYFNGIKNPTREDRIKIIERLEKRFRKKLGVSLLEHWEMGSKVELKDYLVVIPSILILTIMVSVVVAWFRNR